jgi:hypothetical protein
VKQRLRGERGTAIVAAIVVMVIMLGLGLATFATVNTQQSQSGRERTSESAFNLTEGALGTQAFILSRNWPGTSTRAYPSTCTSASTNSRCPDPTRLAAIYDQVDFASGVSWTTNVRDDGGGNANFYDDTSVMAQPSWDANRNRKVWVRSQAIVRGKKRTIVAVVKLEEVTEQLPLNVITAGHFSTNNNGNKIIVDTKGRPLALRCQGNDPNCAKYRVGQVSPDTVQGGYTGGDALSADAIDRLRTRAIANGTYYASGCPNDPTGQIVFVESGDCSYNGGTVNSPAAFGTFVIMNGTLYLGGNVTFYGIVYMGNRQNSTDYVLTMRGTSLISGAVLIDGTGGIEAGASKENVVFDDDAFSAVRTDSSAGVVQNTWREIKG